MKVKLNSNMVTGAIFLVISVWLLVVLPSQIKTYETGSVTAATVPTLLLRCLLVCSVVLFLQGCISKDKKEYVISGALLSREYIKKLKPAIYIGMLLAYAVLLPQIGFVISSLLLANGILLYFRTRKWWFYLIASANVLLAYYVFQAINVTLQEMSKTVGRSSLQTGKWEAKEFRGISRAQKP